MFLLQISSSTIISALCDLTHRLCAELEAVAKHISTCSPQWVRPKAQVFVKRSQWGLQGNDPSFVAIPVLQRTYRIISPLCHTTFNVSVFCVTCNQTLQHFTELTLLTHHRSNSVRPTALMHLNSRTLQGYTYIP